MSMRNLLDLVSKEKIKQEREKAAKKFAVGMGVVAVAGVATGVLIAPKSGKEIRENMKIKAVNTVEAIKDTVQKKVETAKDSAVSTNAASRKKRILSKTFRKNGRFKKGD